MHRKPLSRCLAALAMTASLGLAAYPSAGAAAAAGEKPYLQVESGSHAAFIRRIDAAEDRGLAVTASDDKTARVWDLASGELRHVLRPAVGDGELGRLYGVAIQPGQDLVAVAGTTGRAVGEHRILFYSMASGQLLRAIDARGGDVRKLAWTRDGSLLLAVYAGDNALRAFNADGVMVHEQRLTAPAYGLAVSADGKAAASSLDGRIVVVTAQAGRVAPLQTMKTQTGNAVGLSFSPDGSRLVVGFRLAKIAPEVLDVTTGRSLLRLQQHDLVEGTQLSVAWSQDGQRIAVGGSGYNTRRRFPVFFHDAASGRLTGQHDVAGDTVFDLVALSNGRFAWASHDGTWGVISENQVSLAVRSSIADLKGPETLSVSSDGRRVGWTYSWGSDAATFDFSRRLVALGAAGAGGELQRPDPGRGTGRSTWQDTLEPRINGRAIALDAAEVSRALDYFPDGADAALGTSHRLLRIGARGTLQWQIRTMGEVRSVNVTADGRMIVTGLSDGTLRWWRASDGVPLLALLAARDGRWVAWTPEGYFDAGAGADRLVGWTVNRGDGLGADHFSLNRFRERFNRPDLVDRVLETATPVASLQPAPASSPIAAGPGARESSAVAGASAAPVQPSAPAAPAGATLFDLQFPPVIGPVDLRSMRTGGGELKIPVAVRAEGGVQLEVRVDGRPVPASSLTLPAATPAERSAGTQTATASLPAPAPGSLVQVIARDSNGVSEPLGFKVEAAPGGAQATGLTPVAAVEQPAVSLAAVAPSTKPAEAEPSRAAAPASRPPYPDAPPSLSQPRLFVLAIGISDYKRPEYKLGLAAKDANDFAEAMRAQSGKLYRDVQTRSLINQQATRLAIIANLKWLSDTVGPGDIGMLFLAGHGINAQTGQYYFLPYEGSHEQLVQTGLPEAAIRDTLGRMRGKALFFVDTCFGGNVVGNFNTASRELARMANDLAAAENGVVVFASSSGKQLSEENDAWGNGAFTKAVLSGLSGKADLTRTGRITFKGLDFYVSEEVRKLTEGRQTPVTISPIGVPDFAIARLGAI